MRLYRLWGLAVVIMALILGLASQGCFSNTGAANGASQTPAVVKPFPKVENVIATTTGTQAAYYATLDIKVKNDGAEGTILVQATITQAGKTSKNEMPVFLKQGESHELKLTFPLEWGGGEPTYDVKAIIP